MTFLINFCPKKKFLAVYRLLLAHFSDDDDDERSLNNYIFFLSNNKTKQKSRANASHITFIINIELLYFIIFFVGLCFVTALSCGTINFFLFVSVLFVRILEERLLKCFSFYKNVREFKNFLGHFSTSLCVSVCFLSNLDRVLPFSVEFR